MSILIEAAVESRDAALAAAAGGAHRIELCTDLAHGGTTPTMQIDGDNVARLVRETGVGEVHFSVKDAAQVREVVRSLGTHEHQ